LNELAIAFFGETHLMLLGDVACMLRHFNFGIGRIATMVSATAITLASACGTPAAGVSNS
jgi:hypothetical protein